MINVTTPRKQYDVNIEYQKGKNGFKKMLKSLKNVTKNYHLKIVTSSTSIIKSFLLI